MSCSHELQVMSCSDELQVMSCSHELPSSAVVVIADSHCNDLPSSRDMLIRHKELLVIGSHEWGPLREPDDDPC